MNEGVRTIIRSAGRVPSGTDTFTWYVAYCPMYRLADTTGAEVLIMVMVLKRNGMLEDTRTDEAAP